MKILTELEIKNNVNTFHGMSLEEQQELRMNNCYYIMELAAQASDHISKGTVSAAMLIANYFFIKKDYMEYNRHLIWTAALFLASKINNEHRRIDCFVLRYYKMLNKLKGLFADPPLQSEEKEEIVEGIVNAELAIVKVMFTYEDTIIGTESPYKYLNDYIRSLFLDKDQYIVYQYAVTYLNDTFFTTLPLVHGAKEIALSWVLLASRQLDIPINAIDEAKWYRMVSKYWEFDVVMECIRIMTQFYSQQMDQANKDCTLDEILEQNQWKDEGCETPRTENVDPKSETKEDSEAMKQDVTS